MICAILPVKSPRNAKQRLAGFLEPSQREELARMLYQRTLGILCGAPGIDRVIVATSDAEIAEEAYSAGVDVYEEREQISHSASADAACGRAKSEGATTALLVPIDVPLVMREDFRLLAESAARGLIVVPSSDGTGTNALARTPPDAIESRFGPGSFRAHMDQAREKGLAAEELRIPGLMFDIDTAEDVSEFLSREQDGPIREFLRAVCVWR